MPVFIFSIYYQLKCAMSTYTVNSHYLGLFLNFCFEKNLISMQNNGFNYDSTLTCPILFLLSPPTILVFSRLTLSWWFPSSPKLSLFSFHVIYSCITSRFHMWKKIYLSFLIKFNLFNKIHIYSLVWIETIMFWLCHSFSTIWNSFVKYLLFS